MISPSCENKALLIQPPICVVALGSKAATRSVEEDAVKVYDTREVGEDIAKVFPAAASEDAAKVSKPLPDE